MKLLKIVANNFKLCEDNFTISYVPVANKTEEDKEFELNEIKENLYTFSTIGIVGKNASGKTTAVELLALVYEILSFFRVKNSYLIDIIDKKLNLDITFYHEGYIYRYITVLLPSSTKTITFANELLYKRLYFKTHAKDLFNYDKYEEVDTTNFHLPDDTSMLYYVLKKLLLRGVYLSSDDFNYMGYSEAFDTYKLFNSTSIISKILKMFDEHLENIAKLKEDEYKIYYTNKTTKIVNSRELYRLLSSGTTKGFSLFTFAIYSLLFGADLVIDEIENHFHKTLVENLINLYKDKSVNKHNATLIFTTHYPELLDLFNRADNIYITKYNDKIKLENMYLNYNFRPELSKSKKFYNNAFGTAVDYEALMDFKDKLQNTNIS